MKESWGFLDVKLDELMMLVDTCVRKKGGVGVYSLLVNSVIIIISHKNTSSSQLRRAGRLDFLC